MTSTPLLLKVLPKSCQVPASRKKFEMVFSVAAFATPFHLELVLVAVEFESATELQLVAAVAVAVAVAQELLPR